MSHAAPTKPSHQFLEVADIPDGRSFVEQQASDHHPNDQRLDFKKNCGERWDCHFRKLE